MRVLCECVPELRVQAQRALDEHHHVARHGCEEHTRTPARLLREGRPGEGQTTEVEHACGRRARKQVADVTAPACCMAICLPHVAQYLSATLLHV